MRTHIHLHNRAHSHFWQLSHVHNIYCWPSVCSFGCALEIETTTFAPDERRQVFCTRTSCRLNSHGRPNGERMLRTRTRREKESVHTRNKNTRSVILTLAPHFEDWPVRVWRFTFACRGYLFACRSASALCVCVCVRHKKRVYMYMCVCTRSRSLARAHSGRDRPPRSRETTCARARARDASSALTYAGTRCCIIFNNMRATQQRHCCVVVLSVLCTCQPACGDLF